jgi:hypothetical protein
MEEEIRLHKLQEQEKSRQKIVLETLAHHDENQLITPESGQLIIPKHDYNPHEHPLEYHQHLQRELQVKYEIEEEIKDDKYLFKSSSSSFPASVSPDQEENIGEYNGQLSRMVGISVVLWFDIRDHILI